MNTNSLIGKTETEAVALITKAGFVPSIISRTTKGNIRVESMNCQYRKDRVGLDIVDGVVSSANIG